ncbi:MAG: ankyrin repeat domain-containing protein [Bacteroidota bacterium]
MKLILKSIFLFSFLLFVANIKGQTLKEIYAQEDTAALRQFLAKNDPNECLEGKTMLMKFVVGGKNSMVKYLLSYGVEVNAVCRKGRTALMYAALQNKVEMAQWLIDAGADLTIKDEQGYTMMDLAAKLDRQEFRHTILNNNHRLFTGFDGPHFYYEEKIRLKQLLKNESGGIVTTSILLDEADLFEKNFFCQGKDGERLFEFSIAENFIEEKDKYKMPKQLVAISDIEGNFSAFENLLKSNGVVDEQLNWRFGEGHLVLVGDFFDRGSKVTECLWLIYKLEQEAAAVGGKVHFIIGNHENMNLEGDLRYVHLKYFANAIAFKKNYMSFFSENTFLGKWLRTKNVAVQIGRLLFVHGGISPQFAIKNIRFSTLNEKARDYMGVPLDSMANDTIAAAIFDQFYGPLWYRGYFEEELKTELVASTLDYLGIRKVVVGHTPVEKIQTLHKGRIVAIDVPHKLGEKYQQALFIEKGKFYSVGLDGVKEKVE